VRRHAQSAIAGKSQMKYARDIVELLALDHRQARRVNFPGLRLIAEMSLLRRFAT
jgi:hypothetical protein